MCNNNLTNLPKNMIYWPQLRRLNLENNPFICTCHLYEIVVNISNDIKTDRDGPHCLNQRTYLMEPVYDLQKDICMESVSK